MTLPVPGTDAVVRAWRRLYHHFLRLLDFFPSVLTFVGAACFALASLLPEPTRWVFFCLGCAISALGLVLSYRNAHGARRVQREWDEQRYTERLDREAHEADLNRSIQDLQSQVDLLMAPDAEIASFLLERLLCDLGIEGTSSRASLYTRNMAGEIVLVARFSANTTYRLPGSGHYQLDQGAVARGWEKPYLDTAIPKRRPSWEAYMKKKYGIPDEILPRLRMQSRSLAAAPLSLPQGATSRTVGVVMVEHLDPDGVNGDSQDALTTMPNLVILGSLCRSRNSHAELCI